MSSFLDERNNRNDILNAHFYIKLCVNSLNLTAHQNNLYSKLFFKNDIG